MPIEEIAPIGPNTDCQDRMPHTILDYVVDNQSSNKLLWLTGVLLVYWSR